MENKCIKIIGVCLLGLSSLSEAALIDRGGGLIYDDALDVTWLQDAQYAATTDGILRRNWVDAMTWADELEYYDSVRDTVWSDWRLPTTINDPAISWGWDTTGLSSELAYMYYVNLGYEANTSLDPSDPVPTSDSYNPFINLAYRGYWSGTLVGNGDTDIDAWYFHMHFGYQDINSGLGDELRVWGVMDGDVATLTAVPLPSALLLMGSGLLGIFGISTRYSRQLNKSA